MTEEESREMSRSNYAMQLAALGYMPDGNPIPQEDINDFWENAEEVLAETRLQEMKARPNRPTSYSGRFVKFVGDMHLPSPEEYNEMNDRRKTMDLFERKKLWCPVCGEELILKTTPGGLSKRETICYFECTGCGLTTGKRLTVDEAVDAAVPSEAAKAVTSSEEDTPSSAPAGHLPPEGEGERPGGDKNPFPTVGLATMGRYWLRANELMHSLDHRILLDRERKGYGPTYALRFIRRTDGWRETVKDEDGNVVKDEDGNDVTHDVRKVTWLATYSSPEIATMQWEGDSVLDTLEKMAADVSEWEAEG